MSRLLRKKGSVLFLVLAVMSLLIIAASATYYIVNNQSRTINVRYSSEQSYQTAKSMSGAVSRYISGYLNAIKASGEKEVAKYNNTVVGKMLQGQTVTSKDLDLKALGLTEFDATKVNVTIKPSGKKTVDENTINYFDIDVYSEFNGETTKITQVIAIETGPAEYFTRFLTSTGKRSEDVIVSAFQILSGAYFENDFTRLSNAHMNDSVYVSGTFDDNGVIYHRSLNGSQTDIIVNENFYCKGAEGSVVDVNDIYVGGNFQCTKQILADNVYVLGDYICNMAQGASNSVFYIDGDCKLDAATTNGTDYQKFYINGDLYINSESQSQGEFHVKGNVIIPSSSSTLSTKGIECGGQFLYANGTEVSPGDGASWSGEAAPTNWYNNWHFTHNESYTSAFDEEKVANAANHIANNTAKNKYGAWDAEKYFNETFPDAATIKPSAEAYHGGQYTDDYSVTITESCKLQPADWSYGKHYITIDASDDDIYIYLDSNGLTRNGRDCFAFNTGDGDAPANIIVKGTHSVIFVLPENTDFRIGSSVFVGHIGLAEYMTGALNEEELKDGANIRNSFKPTDENIVKMQDLLISGENDSVILDRTKLSDGETHNNIFLVTKGTSNYIDIGGEATFCGYMYAPSSVMRCDESGQTIGFLGGLIMGSYTYKNMNATLGFTTPYDYDEIYGGKKKTDIVKQLMSIAATGSADIAGIEFKDSYIVGYK